MAAITGIVSGVQATKRIVSGAAQATTGQTTWVGPPSWAKYGQFFFSLTAVAGTTPIFTPSFLVANPITLTDTTTMNLAEHTAFTGLTQAGLLVVEVGPGLTGIANDVTNSATVASWTSINAVLPALLGIKILNDRADGNETYTYTVDVRWSR